MVTYSFEGRNAQGLGYKPWYGPGADYSKSGGTDNCRLALSAVLVLSPAGGKQNGPRFGVRCGSRRARWVMMLLAGDVRAA